MTHLYIIGGFRGHFPPNQMYFGMDIQNAYLAEDRAMLRTLKASVMFLKTQIGGVALAMGTVDVSITEIKQPEELLAFIRDNAINIVMTDKEAEMLLGYMEGHDYVVGFAEGKLYRGDLDDVPGEIVWDDDFSVDDLIDTVCEWNYELILDMDAERQNPKDMIDFSNKQSKYESLKRDEAILDRLFDQTKYSAGIEKMAEELANQFIQNLNQKGLNSSVEKLVSDIRQPAISGRAR